MVWVSEIPLKCTYVRILGYKSDRVFVLFALPWQYDRFRVHFYLLRVGHRTTGLVSGVKLNIIAPGKFVGMHRAFGRTCRCAIPEIPGIMAAGICPGGCIDKSGGFAKAY